MIFVADYRSSRIPNWDGFRMAADLRDAILRLEESRRLVYCLVYLEQLTIEEIAVVLERPEDEVAALFYWAHVDLGAIESQSNGHGSLPVERVSLGQLRLVSRDNERS